MEPRQGPGRGHASPPPAYVGRPLAICRHAGQGRLAPAGGDGLAEHAGRIPAQWDISNSKRQASRGKWAGKPLAEYPYAWCERVIDTPAEWVRYQVFLVINGPWADAELFCAYQPVQGIPREGGQWFEITESLVYGGEAPLDLRLKDPGDTTPSPARDAPPSITLELVPTGPRFDGISVRQDPEKRELEVNFELRRPKFILGLPVRLPEIPLIVQFSYEAADGSTIYRFDQNIGPMPAEHRMESLRLPLVQGGCPASRKGPPAGPPHQRLRRQHGHCLPAGIRAQAAAQNRQLDVGRRSRLSRHPRRLPTPAPLSRCRRKLISAFARQRLRSGKRAPSRQQCRGPKCL